MYEIKFRGLPIRNVKDADKILYKKDKFVYGNLIVDDNRQWIVSGIADVGCEYINLEFWCPVRPETVGQYTGFNDSDGQGIYTGDILLQILTIDGESLNCRRFVAIEDGCFVAKNTQGLWPETELLHNAVDRRIGNTVIVVGNIHQNLELLDILPFKIRGC